MPDLAADSILVVEDTPADRKLTRLLLTSEGYNVRTAASAEEALDILKTFRPRLILLDLLLPGMDGMELAHRLKSSAGTRDMTVVALTAWALQKNEHSAQISVCDGYLLKPIDTRAFPSMIKLFMSGK